MIRTLWAQGEDNDVLANWCIAHIGTPGLERGFYGGHTTMGVFKGETFDGSNLIGVCVFHNFQPEHGTIEISGASISPRWMPVRVQMEALAYVFEHLKCQLTFMRVSEHNERLQKILRTYGFSEYRMPRFLGRETDEIYFTLTDDDWRKSRFYQERKAS